MVEKTKSYLKALVYALAVTLASVGGAAHAQYAIPTPAAPFVDGAQVLGGAFTFLPELIEPMAAFVVVSLALAFAPRILRMVRSIGKR